MPYKKRCPWEHRALVCLCWRRWKQHFCLRRQEICFTPVAKAATSPSSWEHLEMLQDNTLFTPLGLELCVGGRVLTGKFSSSHGLFSRCFSSLLIPWLFSRLCGHRSMCLPGTHQECVQTGCWLTEKLAGCRLAPGLCSHLHWAPSFLAPSSSSPR